MLDPTKRFSNRVENYVRYRPGYPDAIIDLLREACGLTRESIVADVGSGTGKLAELFLNSGNKVFGVEPNKEMRETGERLLKHFPDFISIEGTAESTTLPKQSADFITAGQAFHWFQSEPCRTEFSRILKPNGWVVIVWNDRQINTRPFLADYENLLRKFGTDYEKVNHRRVTENAAVEDFFRTKPRLRIFPNSQQFDFDGLKGRLLSSSYTPEAGQSKHNEMLTALKRIFDAHQSGGRVVFEYDTLVYYGRLVE
ncbi:MAG TPA: class I SAM-dependent methyltransferase [Verrucomicrobiae bacterium]|nr:class I SAM-dependent methyltransferase [Verrucomicrobiae bacterium]